MTTATHPGLSALTRAAATTCILTTIVFTPVHAQDVYTRGVLGAGVSMAGGGPATNAGAGISGHAGLRHQRGSYVLSARVGMNVGGSAHTTLRGGLRDRFDEIAVLVGYAVHGGESSQIVLSTGLAAVSGERVAGEEGDSAGNEAFGTRIGLPLQLALSTPGPGSGFGLVVHANVNGEEVFGAVTATFLIGFDRER